MAANPRPGLSPHYYRDNFLKLCDTVQSRYGDLLLAPERDLLDSFRALDFPAQCLYVRLVSRVGPWFRADRLAYPEIGDVPRALDALLEAGLAAVVDELPLEDLGRVYTRPELLRAFGELLPEGMYRDKPSLLCAVGDVEPDPARRLRRAGARVGGPVVTPLGAATVQLLQLLFFGNRHQSLTEFVLSDLEIVRYYPYALDGATRFFTCREAIEEYLACAGLADRHRELIEEGGQADLPAVAIDLLALEPLYGPTERRWHRQCNALARDLERSGDLELAERLYSRSRRHPARERRARILERRGEWAEAVALCEEILRLPWCEEEREAAGRILPRVRRRFDGTVSRRRHDRFESLELKLPRGEGPVELQAAAALAPRWDSVHYVENRLMNALFGLAFWEQIFAPVPGAFHNPFQGVPADMYEPGFARSRQAILSERLRQLRGIDLRRELREACRRYGPYHSPWVNWRYVDEQLVAQAVTIIPGDSLLAIWERILFDPRANRRGFPDLLALGAKPGDYCLVEVKGPGDSLQEHQKRWLRFFLQRQIPAAVARVEWSDG